MAFLAVICVLLVGLIVYEKRQNAVREREWSLERGVLLTRIQHPEIVQVGVPDSEDLARQGTEEAERKKEEADDIDLVGTIQEGQSDGD